MSNLIENFPEILTACRFYLGLELDGSQEPVDGYFMECRGFKVTQDVIEICEVTPQKWGDQNERGRAVRTKIPGNVKVNNITLRRGLTISQTLWNWFNAVQIGNWDEQRRDGALSIYDQEGTMQARFEFQAAWPLSYTVTDVSAASNEVEIEEVELACEAFMRTQ
jgi:phage tail-like protein